MTLLGTDGMEEGHKICAFAKTWDFVLCAFFLDHYEVRNFSISSPPWYTVLSNPDPEVR